MAKAARFGWLVGPGAEDDDPDMRLARQRRRVTLAIAGFVLAFAVISIRLVDLSLSPQVGAEQKSAAELGPAVRRPDIVDRNGHILATDIQTASLFADAERVLDVDEAIEQLTPVLPDLDVEDLRRKLQSKKRFVWIKRELTPRQQSAIHNLGIPAFGFRKETRRVYPTGRAAAHALGAVNIDSQGIAGIEKYIEDHRDTLIKATGEGGAVPPVALSIDLRVQYALRDELVQATQKYSALGGAGIVLDVKTGELLGMVSLPDYDPNQPAEALDEKFLNRNTTGVYELGSTFKTITTAMALDYGVATMESRYDARTPIRVGRFRINDFHGQNRVLTVPEIFTYSSNIATARMALDVGMDRHQAFLKRLRMMERLKTEMPEAAMPLWPRDWKPVSTMTIAFGHGISVTPLHLAAAGAALMNGGLFIQPTLLRRDELAARAIAERVVKPETSANMRELMRLNVEKGTATHARVDGISVGGKTGTAEKVKNGRYDNAALLTSFLGMFPTEDPRYMVLIVLDEPKGIKETHGFRTSGWNAAPVTAKVIRRIAPMLGILPRLDHKDPFGESAPAIN
jgi:cell division protein FtsI (penicillin-binding protein 3)